MRHVGQVGIGSYEHISGMVMVGHMSIEVIRAFIPKALMPLVFIRTFPSCLNFDGSRKKKKEEFVSARPVGFAAGKKERAILLVG